MSDPKQVHIQGDVDIDIGLDADLGSGMLYVKSATGGLDVEGATTLDQVSINTTDGQFLVNGSNKINFAPTAEVEITAGAASFFKTTSGALDIESEAGTLTLTGNATSLISDTTAITVTGATGVTMNATANSVTVNAASNFDVNASNSITLDATATSNFTVTGSGNLNLNSTAGKAIIAGGNASSDAVTISATDSGGGIDINAGSTGITIDSTAGFSIDGVTASNISIATIANSQDLTLAVTGSTDSSVIINSSGTGTDAIKLTASGTSGGIDVDAGTSGFILDTTGSISLDSAGASNFTVTGAFDLTTSSTAGSVIINGGEAAVDAITLTTGDVAGGIDINAGTGGVTLDTTAGFSIDGASTSNITLTGTDIFTINNTGGQLILRSNQAAVDAVRIYGSNAAGGIDIDSGTGGIDILSQGLVSIDATGAASNFSLVTNAAAQDLTIALTGTTDSSLVLSSTGTSTTDAISITASAGGIIATSAGAVSVQTTDTTNGVSIATLTAGVPVNIGTATSVTTIAGDLVVSGVTTTINTETVLIEDNIILVNAGTGELGNDGGTIVRRYQIPSDSVVGDVVSDTQVASNITGAFQAGSTLVDLVLDAGASAVNDFYNGMWIKITSGPQANKVRRIKDYVGSTKTATIYVTADNITGFSDGLDLSGTVPAATNTYVIYTSPYVGSFYDESADQWTLAFTNLAPDALSTPGTSTVNIQRYAGLSTGAIYIQDNGVIGSSSLNVNVINEATFDNGVTIEGVNINNGLINGLPADVTQVIALPNNATTGVAISTATIGAYFLLVDAVQALSGSGSFLRLSGGAFACFAVASTGTGGAINRLASTKGTNNERVDAEWNTGETVKLRHAPASGLGGTTNYRVKISKVV
jgi:hypothetical protein